MALGPGTNTAKRAEKASAAEKRIDEAIRNTTRERVTVATSLLGIDRSIWDEFLRPKYKRAGWRTAEWVADQREGDFIDLQ